MGLPLSMLRFIAREHRRQPVGDKVLTLGRQFVYATLSQVETMLKEEQVRSTPLPTDFDPRTNIPAWRGTALERNTSDVAFFSLLGCREVRALDYSAVEGAELIADMNQPVTTDWHEQFDLVVDTGTLEHIFHVPQALENVFRLTKVGGRVLHVTPANNWLNHGLYQFSPTLYWDFYRQNGFANVRVFVAEQVSHRDISSPLDVFEVHEPQPCLMLSNRRIFSMVVAEKTDQSTGNHVPMQSFYSQMYGESSPVVPEPTRSFKQRMKEMLPTSLKTFVRNHVPGFDPARKPWGLKFWGRLR